MNLNVSVKNSVSGRMPFGKGFQPTCREESEIHIGMPLHGIHSYWFNKLYIVLIILGRFGHKSFWSPKYMGIPWQFSGWDSVLSLSSVSGGGTKIPQAMQCGQKRGGKKGSTTAISPNWRLDPDAHSQQLGKCHWFKILKTILAMFLLWVCYMLTAA